MIKNTLKKLKFFFLKNKTIQLVTKHVSNSWPVPKIDASPVISSQVNLSCFLIATKSNKVNLFNVLTLFILFYFSKMEDLYK